MKKTLLTLVLLVMAMTVGAQSVKVDYHKGDVRKYTTNVSLSMGIPMQGEQKCGLTAATTYTVDEAGDDGYQDNWKRGGLETKNKCNDCGKNKIEWRIDYFDGLWLATFKMHVD